MTYSDYIKLGFKRVECPDNVAFEQTGFQPYCLEFKPAKGVLVSVYCDELTKPRLYINQTKPHSVTLDLTVEQAKDLIKRYK